MNAIEIRRVEKWYGSVAAVHEFHLDVREGEFVALLGPSGCGKTTTLRMIAGLDQPTRGEIYIKGKLVNDVPVHRRNIGMVFQNHALFPHKTAFGNVAFGLKYRNVAKPDIERRVRRALDLVRLPHVAERLPVQMSGGQQQRIALARAIVIEPDLLLADEPLSSLDAALREEMRIEIKRIQRSLGITTIFVTHDQAEALSLADKVVLMRDGYKEQEGSPEEVYNRPASEFVTRFFGAVNEVKGTLVGREGGEALVRVGEQIVVRVPDQPSLRDPVRLLLRAERIRVGRNLPAEDSAVVVPARIVRADYLGMLARYFVEASGMSLQVVQPLEGPLYNDNEVVSLRIRAADWAVGEPAKN